MTRALLLVALWGVACAGRTTSDPAAPTVSSLDRTTQVGRYRVALTLDPEPPRLGELFRVQARVTLPDGRPVETAKVQIDARMPQHDHGMETRPRLRAGACEADTDAPSDTDTDTDAPRVCRHPDGRYVFDGFKFHMAGAWTILVQVEGPRGPDSTSIVYEAR